MSGLAIREATADDAATLAALIGEAFASYRGRLDPPSGAHGETEASVRRRLATMKAALATVGDRPVGCVLWEPGDGAATLSRHSVRPPDRRRGVGRALVAYVEGRAREAGKDRVRLGVRIVLPRLQAYYTRLGYRRAGLGTHAGCAKPTYVILEKGLARP